MISRDWFLNELALVDVKAVKPVDVPVDVLAKMLSSSHCVMFATSCLFVKHGMRVHNVETFGLVT